jgi:hypothetical protein
LPLDGCGSGQMVSVLVAVLCPPCVVMALVVRSWSPCLNFKKAFIMA